MSIAGRTTRRQASDAKNAIAQTLIEKTPELPRPGVKRPTVSKDQRCRQPPTFPTQSGPRRIRTTTPPSPSRVYSVENTSGNIQAHASSCGDCSENTRSSTTGNHRINTLSEKETAESSTSETRAEREGDKRKGGIEKESEGKEREETTIRTVAVFLDITKAFDLSNSISILSSLVRAGVKGKLSSSLRDFLTDRKGFLCFQNGTPQGSTLSPTLFTYLVDQLHDLQLPRGVKLLGYADDFVLYQPNDSHHIHNDLAVSLRAIEEKLLDIGLQISVNKTKVAYFGRKTNPPHFDLFIDNAPLEWVDEFKYLSVFIDRQLNFKRHALHLKTKARCRLDAMKVIAV